VKPGLSLSCAVLLWGLSGCSHIAVQPVAPENAANASASPTANPTTASSAPAVAFWQGRLSLTVPASSSQDAAQAYFASFELRGQALAGDMTLLSPLGQTLVVLQWSPSGARWVQHGQTREFESVAAMTEALSGQPIPLQALFDWLRGQPSSVPGWQVDTQAWHQGKISAKRSHPPAELKVIVTP
jgi:outer membrane lipoprotein LolB